MYIYECIKFENDCRALQRKGAAATPDRIVDCGTPDARPGTHFQFAENSKNYETFSATRSAAPCCALMNIIHFSSAVIHKLSFARSPRAGEKSSRLRRKKTGKSTSLTHRKHDVQIPTRRGKGAFLT
jgi:hypothetical protein